MTLGSIPYVAFWCLLHTSATGAAALDTVWKCVLQTRLERAILCIMIVTALTKELAG